MDKKLITFVAFSVAVFVLWNKYVAIPPQHPAVVADGGTGQASPQTAQNAGVQPEASKTQLPAAPLDKAVNKPVANAPVANAPVGNKPVDDRPRQPEKLTSFDVPGRYHAVLTTYGAALHDFELQDPAYREVQKKGDVPIDLVSSKATPLPFDVTFPGAGFELPPDADFTLESETGNERRFAYATSGGVTIEKRYTFDPKTYELRLDVTVENKSDHAQPAAPQVSLSGWQDPDAEGGLLHRQAVETEAVCVAKSTERGGLTGLLKEAIEVKGAVRVMAIDRKWFALAVGLKGVDGSTCRLDADKTGRITATLTLPSRSVAPSAKETWTFVGYVGPKVVSQLKAVTLPDGSSAHMDDVINYRLWGMTQFFEAPMLWTLKMLYAGVRNWGVAIILLTLLLKIVTWWPTAQSMKSAQAMAKLKPEMDRLKEKYGDDKTKMNQEVMLLYQKHKINPLGGCLPVIIQMPIYISLYSMLGNAVELYRQNLGLWIHDLTAPDPYFILPLATGAVMFVQQRFSPTPPDPQQKTMMMIMPIMFTGMSMFLPSGLALYIMVNTVFSLIQQRITAPKSTTPHAVVTQ